MSVSILYQDSDLVVVHKPAGLLVHRTALDRYETQFAMQMVRDLIGQSVYTVHRLDKPTSGVLAFALSSDMARDVSQQFAGGLVRKTYLAVVRGRCPEQVLVDYPLKEELDGDDVGAAERPAQPALTEVRCLGHCELPYQVDRYPTSWYSLVEAKPKTGRKHQIRRHLRHLGHPIVGDITYGVGKHNRFFENQFSIRRLLLAATEIELTHPRTKEVVKVSAPLSDDFKNLIERLGWSGVTRC